PDLPLTCLRLGDLPDKGLVESEILVVIEMEGAEMAVDVALLGEQWSHVRPGVLCQWMGRLLPRPGLTPSWVLQAYLVRIVEGLDAALFQQALAVQRAFLNYHS